MATLTKPLSALLFMLSFMSICILKNPSLVYMSGLASKTQDSHQHIQDIASHEKDTMMWPWTTTTSRRRLIGPGSSPPRCIWKCGRCTPCKPVHVTVPPGIPVTTEYYPEAWRCKCGSRLYKP